MRHTLVLVFTLATFACEPNTPTTRPPTEPTSTSELEPESELGFEPITAAGPAYFAVHDRGIARMSEAGVIEPIELGTTGVSALEFGSDGTLYRLDVIALLRLEGERFVNILELDYQRIGAGVQLAFGPDRSVWVRGTDGVGRYHEGQWRSFDRAELGVGVTSIVGLALDREGRAWLATLDGLHFRDPADERMPDPPWQPIGTRWAQHDGTFLGLVARADQRVYLVGADTLDRFEPREGLVALSFLAPGLELMTSEVAISPRGRLALASSTCTVVDLDPERRGTMNTLAEAPSWGCESLSALALDAKDRVWIASSAGLHVLGEGAATFYRSGSFTPLVGRIESIAVWGSGPTSLPSVPEPARFRLRATFMRGGQPLAGAPVEVCPAPSLAGSSPCAHSPHRRTTTSDGAGKIELELPMGDYALAAKVEGKWDTFFQGSFAGTLREAEVHDLGVQETVL